MPLFFKTFLVYCLLLQSSYGLAICSDPVTLFKQDIPHVLHAQQMSSLRGKLKVDIQKQQDQIHIHIGEVHWVVKLTELVSFYRDLRQTQKNQLPKVWGNEQWGTELIRAEYDYWIKKLYLQGEMSLQPNRLHRIVYMLTHRDFLASVLAIVLLPLGTWYAGHAIHFTYFDHWNKFEKTFLHVNALSRTFGNLIRLDEIHYHNPQRSMAQLFWLVICVSLAFQCLGTAITAVYGEPVYPQLTRAVVVALAVILYDIPISRWVHRFQFSNWLSQQNVHMTANDIERSQWISEMGIQTFLRVSGTVVLQMLIYLSNRIFELTWPLVEGG